MQGSLGHCIHVSTSNKTYKNYLRQSGLRNFWKKTWQCWPNNVVANRAIFFQTFILKHTVQTTSTNVSTGNAHT